MAHIKANLDLYANDDGKLVPAGDDARMLVARAGRNVPPRFAGQVTSGGNIKAKKPVADKAQKPAEDKAKTQAVKKPKKRGGKK